MRRFEGTELTGIDKDGLFTERQLECLVWAAEGKEYSAIGLLIGRSKHVAKKHVAVVMAKLGANSRELSISRAFIRGYLSAKEHAREMVAITLLLTGSTLSLITDNQDMYRRPPRTASRTTTIRGGHRDPLFDLKNLFLEAA